MTRRLADDDRSQPDSAARRSQIAAAVDAWRAFAQEIKTNPRFAVTSRFGEPITDPALTRIREAWGVDALPQSVVDFLRVVDGFEVEVRQADGGAGVFVDALEQDPPHHHFWGSTLHANGPADLLFGDDEPRRFLMLDEPAPEVCHGFLIVGDVGHNPRVSEHKAGEESEQTRVDLAGYLENTLADTRATVAQAERLLVEREKAKRASKRAPSASPDAVLKVAKLTTHDSGGRLKKRLKKGFDPAAVEVLEVRVKDPKRPFDMGLLAPFGALRELTVVGAPPSIELAPLQGMAALTSLMLWFDFAPAKDEPYLPDLPQVSLGSVQTVQLHNLAPPADWSALGAFPNAREVELTLCGEGVEVGALDVWPKAESIFISGDGQTATIAPIVRLSGVLQRLVLSSLGLPQVPAFEGGAALRELHLDHNAIVLSDDRSLALPELTQLSLQDNKIEVVAGVEGLDKLQRLTLYGNPLVELDGLDVVADGCEVGLGNCGLAAEQQTTLEEKHGARLRLVL